MKPQNVIVAAAERRVKMIDLGAAADLRVGINYVPNEFLLDPRYAPPQQYIMSKWVRTNSRAILPQLFPHEFPAAVLFQSRCLQAIVSAADCCKLHSLFVFQ